MPFEVSQKIEKPKVAKVEDATLKAERTAIEEEIVYRKGTASIRDLIAPAAMKVEPSFVQLGDVCLRTLFIIAYPRYLSVGWFSPVINFNTTLDIGMFFYPIQSYQQLVVLSNTRSDC